MTAKTNDDLVLTHVAERDIDLLLAEELSCSLDFQRWFVSRVDPRWLAAPIHRLRVRHSVSSTGGPGYGETDLELTAVVGVDAIRLFLENKIDAAFTEGQPERYRARVECASREDPATVCRAVLLCPTGYAGATCSGFDRTILYEDILAFFRDRADRTGGELGARLAHRASVLEQAIYRLRRGYIPKPVVEVTSLWEFYYQIASREYPGLRMPPPREKPGDSYSVWFPCLSDDPRAPKCRLEHVMERGTVTILVAGLAPERLRIAPVIQPFLPAGATLRQAGKSLGITCRVPPIRRMEPASQQEDAIRAALEAALRLRRWHDSHSARLPKWFAGEVSEPEET